jgi:serine/threonine protein phosphatase PrpC
MDHLDLNQHQEHDLEHDFVITADQQIQIPSKQAIGLSLQGNLSSKPNQDRIMILEREGQKLLLFGVFDGHGHLGHVAAELCVQICPGLFTGYLEEQQGEQIALALKKTLERMQEILIEFTKNVRKDVLKAANCYDEFMEESNFEKTRWEFGTTAYLGCLDYEKRELHVANVGDSSAVVFSRTRDSNIWDSSKPLEEHNPLPESERPKGVEYPIVRLAMSRSLGHLQLQFAGISSTPDIRTIRLNPRKEYFILAGSDGLWNAVDCTDIPAVLSDENLSFDAKVGYLLQTSHKFYTLKQITRDDISLILIKVNAP